MTNGDASYPGMDEVIFTHDELVHYVRDALKSMTTGEDPTSYEELIGVMHDKERPSAERVALLVTYLKALSGAVSSLDLTHHDSLLKTIFSMSMWNYVPLIMDALIDLIISLAASNGKYVDQCIEMLIENFIPPPTFLGLLKHPAGLSKKDQVLPRVHSALESITSLIPLAPMRLLLLVVQKMPRPADKETNILLYVENMFRLESGSIGQLVGSNMLVAVVDRLIDLDLDIGWEAILQDDADKGIFQLELEGIEDDENPYPVGKDLSEDGNKKKLDNLMVLTFEHLKSCKEKDRLTEVFEILLHSFRTTILTAYKSKFAQFVMFYACALDPEDCGVRFATILADIFTCSDYPPMTRMSAVAYLASYMARGKFVSTHIIIKFIRRLVDWSSNYCKVQNSDANPVLHRVFYSGCQAIMYVLCFRMRSLVNVSWLKTELSTMPIESVLMHRLNPLKVCLPSVVEEFLRQAKAAHLFTVSKTVIFNDLLESELSKAYGGFERLDMFFPFDPCLLKNSDRYIRPHYISWSMVRTRYCEDEEGSSEEDEEEEDEGFADRNSSDHEMATSFNGQAEDFDVDEFDHSLDKMSITPKNYKWGGNMQPLAQMPSKLRPSTSPPPL